VPALREALEPMPLRTDLVSGAECDRVAWLHHAAAETIGQGEERGTRRPGDPSQGCLDDPLTGRLARPVTVRSASERRARRRYAGRSGSSWSRRSDPLLLSRSPWRVISILGVLSRPPAAFYFARRALIIYADHGTKWQQIASSRQLLGTLDEYRCGSLLPQQK